MNRAEPGPAADNRLAFLWLALIGLAALWTFKAALGFEFIAIDDSGNITLNPHMGHPGAWNLPWMFTDVDYVRRYIPFGWLGFSTVFAAAGLSAEGYHAANLVLHVANTGLLLALLVAAVRRWGPARPDAWTVSCAAFAAALWALHPFRAESIGWISGLLYGQSGFFALLSVLAYLRVAAQPERSPTRWAWLAATALFFLASLLTYPIAIGLLATYFAVDLADGRPLRVVREKWLLALPAVLVAVVTLAARYRSNALWPAAPTLSEFPVSARVMQGFYVFTYYLWKTLAPTRLTPAPTDLYEFNPFGTLFLASAFVVIGLSVALWRNPAWRRGPLLAWGAYLALLVPIAGFTEHPHYTNDRYSYLPGMVIAAALALGLARVSRASQRAAVVIVVAIAAIGSAVAARRQLEIWRNSDTVFIRIIEGTPNAIVRKQNFVRWAHAEANLGRYAEARAIMAERLREYPDSTITDKFDRTDVPRANVTPGKGANPAWSDNPPEAEGNLEIALEAAREGRDLEAGAHFQRALEIAPGYADAQYNDAMFLGLHGEPRRALHLYFILSAAQPRRGFKGEGRLLSVIAGGFWARGDRADARSAALLALAAGAREGDPALLGSIRRQAAGYGIQTLPALRDSTIR